MRVFGKPCNKFDTDEVRVGAYSLADVLDRRVRQPTIIDEAIATIGDQDTWEVHRTMGFLRDEDAWQSQIDVIVFWMTYFPDRGGDQMLLCYASGYVDWVIRLDELREKLDASDAIAARLGIDPAPPELRAWCRD